MPANRPTAGALKRRIYLIVLPIAGLSAVLVGVLGSQDTARASANWAVLLAVGAVVLAAWGAMYRFHSAVGRIERYLLVCVSAAFAVALPTAWVTAFRLGGDDVLSLGRVGVWVGVIAALGHLGLGGRYAGWYSWVAWGAYAVAVLTAIAWAPGTSMGLRTTLLEVMLAQAAVIVMIQGIVHVTRAERRRAGRFESLATTDGLTELPNRRAAEEHLQREVDRASRYGRSLSLIWFDLDRFKEVNDRFGHAAGDLVLCAIATSLHVDLRENDLLARWGGEEFLVILPEQDQAEAARTATRMRERLKRADVGLPGGARVTASFGVAQFVPEETASELLRRADVAVFRAKRAGRDRAHVSGADVDDSGTDGTLAPGAHDERPGAS